MGIICRDPGIVEIGTVAKSKAITPTADGRILWHIDEDHLTADLDKYKIILAFEKAFQVWQPLFGPIKLESTGNKADAAIVLRFMSNGNPELPEKFSEETLAYAYYPDKKSLGVEADVYFNDAYAWAEMHGVNYINLFKVAVHEIGHALGLDHSKNVKDIMYPQYQPNDSVVITPDTKAGISSLYQKWIDEILSNTASADDEEPPAIDGDFTAIGVLLRVIFVGRNDLMRLNTKQLFRVGQLIKAPVDAARGRTANAMIVLQRIRDI